MEKHCTLRFISGFPLPADLGAEAINALGPNVVLASLYVDTFRALFISPDEAKNILVPVEDALDLKRKAGSELE